MSGPSAAEQFNRDLESLRRAVDSLHDKAALRDVRSDMESIERLTGEFGARLAAARAGGYALADQADNAAQDVHRRWWQARSVVQRHITTESYSLDMDWRAVEAQAQRLAHTSGHPSGAAVALSQAQSAVRSLEAKIEGVERNLRAIYEPVYDDARRFDSLLDRVEWMMKQISEASFAMQGGEAPIRAVKAVYAEGEKEDKDDPKGVLYLTTQRLVFEQKQDVATKKVLFITTEKQRVQRVLIDVPLERVSNAEAKKMGLMGHEDHVGVVLSPADPVEVARFHIDGQDCMVWQAQVMQARRGELAAMALA